VFGHLNNSGHTINQSNPSSGSQMGTQIVFGTSPYLKIKRRPNTWMLIDTTSLP
jgi:hypothetical protein